MRSTSSTSGKPAWGQLPASQAPSVGAAPAVPSWDLPTNACEAEKDSGAEDGRTEQLAETVLQEYAAVLQGEADDAGFGDALARVRQHLADAAARSAACLVCLEPLAPGAAVWHCSGGAAALGGGCFCMVHLLCAQAWARSQQADASVRAAARAVAPPDLSAPESAAAEAAAWAHERPAGPPGWACPKCRAPYTAAEAPREYRCFCGKVADPPFDPWAAPHSCGVTCGRPLLPACGHACVLLCHPGPCPPCPAEVSAECHCGKARAQRRCARAAWSCGKLCGARLRCGHCCPRRCHPGACPPCALSAPATCLCGAETRAVPCSERPLRCERICGKLLPCKRHRCTSTCHAPGECSACPNEGLRTCPCGKVEYRDLACDEAAPTCGATCNRLLACGRHRCTERCHTGACTTVCREVVRKSCACGRTQREVPCGEPLRCERRCQAMRACGRHQCKRRCCDGSACGACDQPCSRRLRCGNHICPGQCHTGPCQPCPLTAMVACACGGASYAVPCGSEVRAEPPLCTRACLVPRLCRHAAACCAHKCHFGACPPCPERCGSVQACGHVCGSRTCHDAAPPAVPAFAPPPSPVSNVLASVRRAKSAPDSTSSAAQAAAAAVEARPAAITACPPCQAPVRVACLGGHTTREWPCCDAPPACACDSPCGRMLPCGRHACTKPCHALAGSPTNGGLAAAAPDTIAPAAETLERAPGTTPARAPPADAACGACRALCGRRRAGCTHGCGVPCHAGACPPCGQPVASACHCVRSTVMASCDALLTAHERGGAALAALLCCGKPCARELPACGHICGATCHPGPCPGAESCDQEVTVRCACRRQKGKTRCAEARALAAARGLPAPVQGVAVALLDCDAKCLARARERKGAKAKGVDGHEADAVPNGTSDGAADGSMASGVGRIPLAAAGGSPAVAAPPAEPPDKATRRRQRQAERDAADVLKRRQRARRDIARRVVRALGRMAVMFALASATFFVYRLLTLVPAAPGAL